VGVGVCVCGCGCVWVWVCVCVCVCVAFFVFPLTVMLASLSFVIPSVHFTSSWVRPGWRAKWVLATSHQCVDSGQETDCTYPCHDLDRSHATNE